MAKDIVFLGVNYSELKLLNEEGFIGQNGKTKCGALQFKYFVNIQIEYLEANDYTP